MDSRKRLLLLGAAMAALGVAGGGFEAQADTIAYQYSAGTYGNQGWTGSLGLEFNTSRTIDITQLGAFDDGGNGFAPGTTIRVGIFNRDTSAQVGDYYDFSGSADTLVAGSRFADVADIRLTPGRYAVVAQGFNAADRNYNSGGAPNNFSSQDGGGAISFVGVSRYNGSAFSYPTIVDGGPFDRYNAGTFQFNVVPVPPAVLGGAALLGLTGGAHVLRRRRAVV